jgi:septal ring factor EnvC (AmiA/AmiB activator)
LEVTLVARQSLTGGVFIAACFLALSPAAAQALSDSEKIERLERQTELLQRQLKALQAEIAETKKKAPKREAAQPEPAARCLRVKQPICPC